MALMTLPGRFPGRLGRASTLLLNLIPDGKIAAAETGQALTFARTTVGGYVADTLGRVRSTIHSQPKYEAVDLDGDGIRETLGLLLEPARTNALLRSQEFDNAAWTKDAATVTANATTAPDGSLTADRLVEAATTARHGVRQATGTLTASTYSSASVWMKAGERTWGCIIITRKDGTGAGVWFDLANGLVGATGTNSRGRIEKYGDGWYRCLASFDALTGATATDISFNASSGDAVDFYAGDTTKGIYLWGAQFEVDAPFPSSYVPTTTAAVTKNVDALSLAAAWPVQDITVYAKVARVWQMEVGAPWTGCPIRLGNGTTYMQIYEDGAASPSLTAVLSDGTTTVSVAGSAGAGPLEWCAQFVNVRSAAKVRLDVGGGFGAFSAAAGALTALNYNIDIGSNTTVWQLAAPLLSLKVAAGARTMDQMRGAY